MWQWYVANEGQRLGPLTLVQLQAMADRGDLQPSDFVCQSAGNRWILASDVAGVFPPVTEVSEPAIIPGSAASASSHAVGTPATAANLTIQPVAVHSAAPIRPPHVALPGRAVVKTPVGAIARSASPGAPPLVPPPFSPPPQPPFIPTAVAYAAPPVLPTPHSGLPLAPPPVAEGPRAAVQSAFSTLFTDIQHKFQQRIQGPAAPISAVPDRWPVGGVEGISFQAPALLKLLPAADAAPTPGWIFILPAALVLVPGDHCLVEQRVSFSNIAGLVPPHRGSHPPHLVAKAEQASKVAETGRLVTTFASGMIGGLSGRAVRALGDQAAKARRQSTQLGAPPRNRIAVLHRQDNASHKAHFDIAGETREQSEALASACWQQLARLCPHLAASEPPADAADFDAATSSQQSFRWMRKGRVRGTIRADELETMIRQGEIQDGDLIAVETWIPVGKLQSFRNLASTAEPDGHSHANDDAPCGIASGISSKATERMVHAAGSLLRAITKDLKPESNSEGQFDFAAGNFNPVTDFSELSFDANWFAAWPQDHPWLSDGQDFSAFFEA